MCIINDNININDNNENNNNNDNINDEMINIINDINE